ncbi:peptidyl-tRNA hydrolase, partial [Thamnocephalis sphaerospora]
MRSFQRHLLLVGLGNHGFDQTRHNIGIDWLNHLVRQYGLTWQKDSRVAGFTADAVWSPQTPGRLAPPSMNTADRDAWTLKLYRPRCLMNISGRPVALAVKAYTQGHEQLLVAHDDLQRELGAVSLKLGGSANGHNGVKSIIKALGIDKFRRLRIGIGRPKNGTRDQSDIANYVLAKFSVAERQQLTADAFPTSMANLVQYLQMREREYATAEKKAAARKQAKAAVSSEETVELPS